jgi:hypothetical protein
MTESQKPSSTEATQFVGKFSYDLSSDTVETVMARVDSFLREKKSSLLPDPSDTYQLAVGDKPLKQLAKLARITDYRRVGILAVPKEADEMDIDPNNELGDDKASRKSDD